jgi:putative ABC transport system permease protein
MLLFKLLWSSMWARRATLLLTLATLSLSTSLLFTLDKVKRSVELSYSSVLSGADLILASRGSPLEILLFTLFDMGESTDALDPRVLDQVSAHPAVAWTLPLAMGDRFEGYRVLGTSVQFFEHFTFGDQRRLELGEGRLFKSSEELVLGAKVAERLSIRLGERLILAHGQGEDLTAHDHAEHPLEVVGILRATGTPFDEALFVSLEAMQHVHELPEGVPLQAILVKLRSPQALFVLQSWVRSQWEGQVSAVIPGLALTEFWKRLDFGERILHLMSLLSMLVSLLVLTLSLRLILETRQREIALYRILGASPFFVAKLLLGEALGLALVSGILAWGLSTLGLLVAQPWLAADFQIHRLSLEVHRHDMLVGGALLGAALVASLAPAYRAYRLSLEERLR